MSYELPDEILAEYRRRLEERLSKLLLLNNDIGREMIIGESRAVMDELEREYGRRIVFGGDATGTITI